jgi:hypothetical protein
VSLTWISQDDFAAGLLRSVGRGIEPGVGVDNIIDGLFDDDGDVYLRGNTVAHTNALDSPLTFLWTGDLGGPVGLVSTATGFYRLSGPTLTALPGGTPVARPVKPAIVAGELFLPNGTSWNGVGNALSGQLPPPLPGAVGSVHLCAAGGRLVIGQGRFVRFSAAGSPHTFGADDFHELPEGAQIRGLAAIKDTVLVFTGYGIWAIENLALDLTDDLGNPQQVMQKLFPELGLLHEAGLTEWAGRIVAPCTDRMLLIDTISAPTSISDSIPPLYMEHVRAGRLPGGAKVFRNHLFLPWLSPDGAPVSTLVCRLNRPVKGRQTYYPFSILSGHAAGMIAGDIAAVTTMPTLLVAHGDGSVVDFFNVLSPSDDGRPRRRRHRSRLRSGDARLPDRQRPAQPSARAAALLHAHDARRQHPLGRGRLLLRVGRSELRAAPRARQLRGRLRHLPRLQGRPARQPRSRRLGRGRVGF